MVNTRARSRLGEASRNSKVSGTAIMSTKVTASALEKPGSPITE
jgi:hypothetical protein